MYIKKSNIAKEYMEINKILNTIFTTDEENNVENSNRLLDLYEMIQDK